MWFVLVSVLVYGFRAGVDVRVDVRCYILYYYYYTYTYYILLYIIHYYYYILYLILYSSPLLIYSFPFPLSSSFLLSSSSPLLPNIPFPVYLSSVLSSPHSFPLPFKYSFYTCRHLDILIYIPQESDPACFIGVDG